MEEAQYTTAPDIFEQIRAATHGMGSGPPTPLWSVCIQCYRLDTLDAASDTASDRWEYTRNRCGQVNADHDLCRLVLACANVCNGMSRCPSVAKWLLLDAARTLHRISRGDRDATEKAGNTARRIIRIFEHAKIREKWFDEID